MYIAIGYEESNSHQPDDGDLVAPSNKTIIRTNPANDWSLP
jgi:hypothetical protein